MVLVQSRTLVRYLWHLHTEQVEQLSNKLLTIVFLLLFVISIASVSRHFLGFLGWLGMRHCPRTVLLYRWHHNSGIQYLYNTALNWCLFVHACHCFSCRFRFVTQCQLSLAVLSPEGSDLGQAVGCPGQKLNWCEFCSFAAWCLLRPLLQIPMLAQAVVRAYLIADEKGYRNLSWVWPLARGDDLQDSHFPFMENWVLRLTYTCESDFCTWKKTNGGISMHIYIAKPSWKR